MSGMGLSKRCLYWTISLCYVSLGFNPFFRALRAPLNGFCRKIYLVLFQYNEDEMDMLGRREGRLNDENKQKRTK